MEQLLRGYRKGLVASQVPRVVLFGAPNAGKSSLVNALIEEDRLLVSQQAGTTRDWVEVRMLLPGGEVALCDTAGLGKAIDDLDRQSQERTRSLLESADLRILVEDGTRSVEVSEEG